MGMLFRLDDLAGIQAEVVHTDDPIPMKGNSHHKDNLYLLVSAEHSSVRSNHIHT
jgi:hypothetical protein